MGETIRLAVLEDHRVVGTSIAASLASAAVLAAVVVWAGRVGLRGIWGLSAGASAFVALAETIGSDLSAYPNVRAWLGRMKALPNWAAVNQVIDGYAASLDRSAMVTV